MTQGPQRSNAPEAERAQAQQALPRPEQGKPRQLASEALFQGTSELEILHDGAVYRLRRTGKGKLLLNK